MDVRIAIPDAEVTAPVLDAGLESLTRLNERLIRAGKAPTFARAVKDGLVWKPEPPGLESFDHAVRTVGRKWGDCDDLAPHHAASLRVTGEDRGARARVYKSGPGRWHAIVERSNGKLEDPSRTAGMRVPDERAGIPAAVVGAMHAASVSGLGVRPGVALRPSRVGWAARCDVPWRGTNYALSATIVKAAPASALATAIQGACLVGAAAGVVEQEVLDRLYAVSLLLRGATAQECSERCGLRACRAAIEALRGLAPDVLAQMKGPRIAGGPFRDGRGRRMSVSGVDFGRAVNSHFEPRSRWSEDGRRFRVSGAAPSARARAAHARLEAARRKHTQARAKVVAKRAKVVHAKAAHTAALKDAHRVMAAKRAAAKPHRHIRGVGAGMADWTPDQWQAWVDWYTQQYADDLAAAQAALAEASQTEAQAAADVQAAQSAADAANAADAAAAQAQLDAANAAAAQATQASLDASADVTQAIEEGAAESDAEAVNGLFGRSGSPRQSVGFDFDLSSITEPLSKIVSPIVKAAAPILKPLEDVYNKIPMPLKAVLAPATLVTEYAYQHPEQIPMFGKFASAAKAVFEKAKAQGHPNPVAVAAQVLHPAMLHPPVAAAVAHSAPAAKLKKVFGLPKVPVPVAVAPHLPTAVVPRPKTLAQVVVSTKPLVDRHIVYVPPGLG